MKKRFLESSINLIKNNKKCSDEEIEIIAYGLEGMYLSITKAIVILGIALLLGIFKEVIYLLVSYNIIRSQAFGIHASKSIYCLISSLIMFIGGAYLCKLLIIPLWFIIFISVICIFCLYLYAPADTEKRPIVNKVKRKRFKLISTFLGILYLILIIYFKGLFISNYLFLGLVISVIMILPITYKFFNMSYNNYKNYGV